MKLKTIALILSALVAVAVYSAGHFIDVCGNQVRTQVERSVR
jgi:hypothetical protein